MKGHKLIAPLTSPFLYKSKLNVFLASENNYLDIRVDTERNSTKPVEISYTNRMSRFLGDKNIKLLASIYETLLEEDQIVHWPIKIHFNTNAKQDAGNIMPSAIASMIYILYESTQRIDELESWIQKLNRFDIDKSISPMIINALLGGLQQTSHQKQVIHKRWSLPQSWDVIKVYNNSYQEKQQDNLLSMLGVALMTFDLNTVARILTEMSVPSDHDEILNDSLLKNHIYGGIPGEKCLNFISTQTNARDIFLSQLKNNSYTCELVNISDGIYRM